ncbi:hypothetical protein PDE_04801 [Penicillium oxalicum 114-2]|uniref:CSC1/OSCA1-like 7TM region domain-containing protein n=1 Tax=Penicillium oxalicum (strain 114-2 / CGMCC 5302) TaxID=933388 RepID=S7ZMG6_PENO1|nr:hypothetical protein PDE_04801 [Penicillium oxalicum 114-2]
MDVHHDLWPRAGESGADKFLYLISNPFVSQFQTSAIWASLGTSLGLSILLALLFSLFRPRHNLVYAPKVKHADRKHAPPPVGKGFFSWVKPVINTREPQLVETVGLDAAIFLRFTKMCRNIFIFFSIIGCLVLVPVNVSQSHTDSAAQSALNRMTPLYVTNVTAIWSQVACAYCFDAILAFFLWRNYKAVRDLRRQYFQSSEYQRSLHARTLMVTDIPAPDRSDEGIMRITDEVNPTAALPRAAIGRNVRDLPVIIKEHEENVRRLESVLAKYLKRPDQLPAKRPTMRPPKSQRSKHPNGKVDAIDYLTVRIRVLEEEIKHGRASIDRRNAMPYGFASWESIEHAHAVAWTARNKHPKGTTIALAPRPSDLIWENLPLTKSARKWKRFLNVIWVTALTIVWIVPNALIAVFLSNLNNLGSVWPRFQTSLSADPKVWAAVQGIASPAVTSLVYLVLPIIFRRLSVQSGSHTKTSRERHVLGQLYAFFVFNNLVVFSLFSAAWTFVATVIEKTQTDEEDAWQAIVDSQLYAKLMSALCTVSPFWVTYILQRNLGATIDLVQMISLAWVWFAKTFLSPTPRQAIEWTAPPPFDYASYYNYFLFYATVALCFATLQPIVLPVTALYFGVDAMLKKYLLMYVFVTKNESAGAYWRPLFNRLIFASILANVIVAIVVKVRGTWTMVFCLVPLPLLMLAFKFYCMKTFDDDIAYFNRANLTDAEAVGVSKMSKKAGDRLNSKFGHPALYKALMTPMVHAKAAEALRQIYQGRLEHGDMENEYSDVAMNPMLPSQPGKEAEHAPFEVVPEAHLDFSYFKDRADFRDEFGGGIYGRPEDLMTERSQTPRSMLGGEWSPSSSRASSPAPSLPSLPGLRVAADGQPESDQSLIHPAFRVPLSRTTTSNNEPYPPEEIETHLLSHAQTPGQTDINPLDRWRTRGYGPVQQEDDPYQTSYEAYRVSR